MSQTIEIEVGDLYANLHEQFTTEVGPQYDERMRQQTEAFLHEFNQQFERQVEQMQEEESLDLSEEDVEALAEE